jgi:hypothetical protein
MFKKHKSETKILTNRQSELERRLRQLDGIVRSVIFKVGGITVRALKKIE